MSIYLTEDPFDQTDLSNTLIQSTLCVNRIAAIDPGKKTSKKMIVYGPTDRNGSLSRVGDQTRGESPARTLSQRLLPDLEPKTYLWRYFAKPLRIRVLANRWRRYTPVAVILLMPRRDPGRRGHLSRGSYCNAVPALASAYEDSQVVKIV